MIKFRKGQIVPRSFGVKVSDRKAQYHIKFGCDVVFEGGVIYPMEAGSVFMIPNRVTRRMNNGTRKEVPVSFNNIHIDGSRYDIQSTMITVGSPQFKLDPETLCQ